MRTAPLRRRREKRERRSPSLRSRTEAGPICAELGLSHRVFDSYYAIIDAAWEAWQKSSQN
jgi:hypothetical protein